MKSRMRLQRHGAERISRGILEQIAQLGALAGAASGRVDPGVAHGRDERVRHRRVVAVQPAAGIGGGLYRTSADGAGRL